MTTNGRPKAATKRDTPKRPKSKLPPLVVGMGTVLEEDGAACSFSPNDVYQLIEESRIKTVTGLAIEEIAIQLKGAVTRFIVSWRRNTSSPPGETRDRAQEIAKRARAFLEIMHANPDDGAVSSHDADVFEILLWGPQPHPRYLTHEDEEGFTIRSAMARRPYYTSDNDEIQRLVHGLLKYHNVFMPSQRQAIELGLRGAVYAARLAVAAARRYHTIRGRKRQAPVPLLGFVEDINKIYRTISGDDGTVTTDTYDDDWKRRGPVVGFTQVVLGRTANLLPERPSLAQDARMRQALSVLARDPSKTAEAIHQIRSGDWQERL